MALLCSENPAKQSPRRAGALNPRLLGWCRSVARSMAWDLPAPGFRGTTNRAIARRARVYFGERIGNLAVLAGGAFADAGSTPDLRVVFTCGQPVERLPFPPGDDAVLRGENP